MTVSHHGISFKEDRYGGILAEVTELDDIDPERAAPSFADRIDQLLEQWHDQGKRGIWVRVPNARVAAVPELVARGFDWHHAKPGYCLLTKWLPSGENKLPSYASTQVGVGGFTLNERGEVLLVRERVSPLAAAQGMWKLPGGLTDPGEDLAETAAREVHEETGIEAAFESVASFRHSHGYAHGVDDIYFVVRMRALSEEIRIDPGEIGEAAWISREGLDELFREGLISKGTRATLDLCFDASREISATAVPSVRGGQTLLYAAPAQRASM